MDQWLATRGFLPGYAFGGDYVSVQFPNPDDDFVRDPQRALREFGPLAVCYAHKRRWRVQGVVFAQEGLRQFKRCPCGRIYEVTAQAVTRCVCGKDLEPPVTAMKMPSMRVKAETRISRWEEIRESRSFIMEQFASLPPAARQALFSDGAERRLVVAFVPKATITTINYRSRFAASDGTGAQRVQPNLEHRPGFLIEGGEWETRRADSDRPESDFRALYASGVHDALHLRFGPCEKETAEAFRATLRTALDTGMSLALRQGPSEIEAFDIPAGGPAEVEILFHEATAGSAGVLSRVLDAPVFHEVARQALESIHFSPTGEDLHPECATACYECLQHFYNQREHRLLNRHLVRDFLVWLLDAEPQPVEVDQWQELIDSIHGPGAENERRFLELLRDHGLPKPAQMHYALPADGPPVAEIDFKVGQVHVLVDGSVHHSRWVHEIDQVKRDALRWEGYTLLEFDPTNAEAGLAQLRAML
jgi:hypothetical protein